MRIPTFCSSHPQRIKVGCFDSYQAMCAAAAADIVSQLKANPSLCLGLATGSTPVGMYKELIAACSRGECSFKDVRTANLDEYIGLGADHPQSYAYFMRQNLFDHVDIDLSATHIPDGCAGDMEAECAAYDQLLDSMPRDIQVLGIGRNGHVGFNEPEDSFAPDTHCVTLTPSTIQANARFFGPDEHQPTQAVTMGIRGILCARQIVLLACGEDKAQAMYDTVFGAVTPNCPASALQLHGNVRIYGDRAALKLFTDRQLDALK